MTYERKTPRSFTLTDENSTSILYSLPDSFNLWQIKEITKIIAQLSKSCTQSGSVILSLLLSAATPEGGEENAKVSIGKAVNAIEKMSGGLLGPSAFEGVGEILAFLSDDLRLAKIAAILFKKPNEKKLDPDTLDQRAELFESEIEPSIIWEGMKDFFVGRPKQSESTASPSPTSEVTKKKSANQTSAKSTATSTASTV